MTQKRQEESESFGIVIDNQKLQEAFNLFLQQNHSMDYKAFQNISDTKKTNEILNDFSSFLRNKIKTEGPQFILKDEIIQNLNDQQLNNIIDNFSTSLTQNKPQQRTESEFRTVPRSVEQQTEALDNLQKEHGEENFGDSINLNEDGRLSVDYFKLYISIEGYKRKGEVGGIEEYLEKIKPTLEHSDLDIDSELKKIKEIYYSIDNAFKTYIVLDNAEDLSTNHMVFRPIPAGNPIHGLGQIFGVTPSNVFGFNYESIKSYSDSLEGRRRNFSEHYSNTFDVGSIEENYLSRDSNARQVLMKSIIRSLAFYNNFSIEKKPFEGIESVFDENGKFKLNDFLNGFNNFLYTRPVDFDSFSKDGEFLFRPNLSFFLKYPEELYDAFYDKKTEAPIRKFKNLLLDKYFKSFQNNREKYGNFEDMITDFINNEFFGTTSQKEVYERYLELSPEKREKYDFLMETVLPSISNALDVARKNPRAKFRDRINANINFLIETRKREPISLNVGGTDIQINFYNLFSELDRNSGGNILLFKNGDKMDGDVGKILSERAENFFKAIKKPREVSEQNTPTFEELLLDVLKKELENPESNIIRILGEEKTLTPEQMMEMIPFEEIFARYGTWLDVGELTNDSSAVFGYSVRVFGSERIKNFIRSEEVEKSEALLDDKSKEDSGSLGVDTTLDLSQFEESNPLPLRTDNILSIPTSNVYYDNQVSIPGFKDASDFYKSFDEFVRNKFNKGDPEFSFLYYALGDEKMPENLDDFIDFSLNKSFSLNSRYNTNPSFKSGRIQENIELRANLPNGISSENLKLSLLTEWENQGNLAPNFYDLNSLLTTTSFSKGTLSIDLEESKTNQFVESVLVEFINYYMDQKESEILNLKIKEGETEDEFSTRLSEEKNKLNKSREKLIEMIPLILVSLQTYDSSSSNQNAERFEMTFQAVEKYLNFDNLLEKMLEGENISASDILPYSILINQFARDETFILTSLALSISYPHSELVSSTPTLSSVEHKRFEESSKPQVKRMIEREIAKIMGNSQDNSISLDENNLKNDVGPFVRYDSASDTTVIYRSRLVTKEEQISSPINYRNIPGYDEYITEQLQYKNVDFKERYDSKTLFGLIESTKLILNDLDAPPELRIQAYVVANWLLYENDFNEQVSIRLAPNNATDSTSSNQYFSARGISSRFLPRYGDNPGYMTFTPRLSKAQVESLDFSEMEGIEIVRTIENLNKDEIRDLTIEQTDQIYKILEEDSTINDEVKLKVYAKIY